MGRGATCLFLAAAIVSCRRGDERFSPPLDLLGMTYVVFAPEGDGPASPVSLGGEARPALAAPTPAEFRYRLRIPENAFLTFAIGIASSPSGPSATGESLPSSRMRFTVRAGEKQADQVLFEREIHMSRRDRWLPQAVDLKRYAGREIWLVFQTGIPGDDGAAVLPVVGLFGDPVLHDRGAYRASKGVVLISIDTLRRDHLSLYGYPRRTTPGLEALAQEAVVFEDAVSTASWTLPAHASLLTSTLPSVHGATNSKVGLSPEWPRLPRLLKDAGYFTEAITTHVYLSQAYGFGEGFDRYRYLPETRAEEVTDQAIRVLEARGDSDFFLFLHYYDPHWHYDPPAPYDRAFDPGYQGKATGIWWDFKDLDADSIDPRDLRHIQALYDGEILYTDRQIERLVQEMKHLGVFDDALIVVTSDHGEEFLDHGHWEHQKTLYEELVRIPLLIKLPRGASGGRRVNEQVSLLDVAPTVLDVMGIPPPSTFEGVSLLPAARGSDAGRREAWAETEHTLDGSIKIAMRNGAASRKTIYTLRGDSVDMEIFDLRLDPREIERLESKSPGGELESLGHYRAETNARREGKTRPEVVLDPEELERLRSLGYVK